MHVIDLFTFSGKEEGPSLLLTGAIHGNEKVGPSVLQQMVKDLEDEAIQLDKGKLTIAPICNPGAYREDKRYLDINLNRLIGNPAPGKGYESSLVPELEKLVLEYDFLLDIHSTHMEGDPPFAFANEKQEGSVEFAKALGMPNIFLGWENVYEGEDYSMEGFAGSNGKTALTLECGYHGSGYASDIAQKAISNALVYTGMTAGGRHVHDTDSRVYRFTHCTRKNEGDQFVKTWKHLDPIQKGDTIYTKNNGDKVTSDKDGFILIPFAEAMPGDEFFYFGISQL